MDAREYFQIVVQPNYYELYRAQNSIRLLWNALISMNTVPEFLALHRFKYRLDLLREVIDTKAQEIREELGLTELQYCANTFKHVRKIPRGQSTFQASSTGILPHDDATWILEGHDLVKVVHEAFATLNSLSELKPTP